MKKLILFTLIFATPAAFSEELASEPLDTFYVEKAFNIPEKTQQIVLHSQYLRESETSESSLNHEFTFDNDRHMFSWGLPYLRIPGDPTVSGVGDLTLNYRYQVVANPTFAFTPRLTLTAPTGDYEKGLGSGAWGIELVQTISFAPTPYLMTHWNFGMSVTPGAKEATTGDTANLFSANFGGALIYMAHENLNFMVEAIGATEESALPESEKEVESSFFFVPGIRAGWTFWETVKFMPGVGGKLGLGPSQSQNEGFAWVTLESLL